MTAWGWVSIREQRMIQGLSHLTFIVRDLDRMEALLTTVLGAKKVYDSGKATFSLSKERFFVAGGLWLATMEGEPLPSRTYNHVAFKIEESDYDELLPRPPTCRTRGRA
jgi:fosfomycin resistance protein FosX